MAWCHRRRARKSKSAFVRRFPACHNVGMTVTSGAEPIRIMITGGTFDKEYDELTGRLHFKDSHLPEMLRLGRCTLPLEIRTLMMIDSLDMTAADRNLILEQCRQSPERRVVITHGTDTMAETAQALAAGLHD